MASVRIIRIVYSWSKREDLGSEPPPTQGHSEGGGGGGETWGTDVMGYGGLISFLGHRVLMSWVMGV